jgi:hypothetical protein
MRYLWCMRTYVDEALTLTQGTMVLVRTEGADYVGEVKSVQPDGMGFAWLTLYGDGSVWWEHAGEPVPFTHEPRIFITPTTQVYPQ